MSNIYLRYRSCHTQHIDCETLLPSNSLFWTAPFCSNWSVSDVLCFFSSVSANASHFKILPPQMIVGTPQGSTSPNGLSIVYHVLPATLWIHFSDKEVWKIIRVIKQAFCNDELLLYICTKYLDHFVISQLNSWRESDWTIHHLASEWLLESVWRDYRNAPLC